MDEQSSPRGGNGARAPTAADAVKGLVAGAVAAAVKNAVTTYVYEKESAEARGHEKRARDGQHAYVVAVDKVASAVGADVAESTRQRAAQGVHWSLGIGNVLAYALLRPRYPGVTRARGLAFGLPLTWLAEDEILNPMLGLTPGPAAYPWQTHARGLAGHTALWLTADTTLRALDRAFPPNDRAALRASA